MKELSYYSPIIIPTLCRYEHLKRCVTSLAQNTFADQTELIIGLDYPPSEKYVSGWKQIEMWVDEIKGFKKVTVLRSSSNLGSIANSRRLREYVLQRYDTYIYTEDDNEFSPCFLDYCHKALEKYWDDNHVLGVCGYSFPVDLGEYSYNIYFHHDYSAWGIAKWKHKSTTVDTSYARDILSAPKKCLKLFLRDSRLLFLMMAMIAQKTRWGDALQGARNVIEDKLILYPTVSLCRNHGHDGTGEHGGIEIGVDKFKEQIISSEAHFTIEDAPIRDINSSALKNYFQMSIVEKLSYLKKYIIFKLKNKK